ncbi:MAG TPA: VOC family protein [Bryobacteraceae bacterium]|nr:VOC family protein [Bryobacteraceae bacterium]
MFVGLEQVAIASPNPPALARWYVDHLGFKFIPERDGNCFVRASNGSVIEIIVGQGPLADAQPTDCGLRHLAIQVSDFSAAYASLAGCGVSPVGDPYLNNGNRLAFIKDGEGNLRHLIQRKEPLP